MLIKDDLTKEYLPGKLNYAIIALEDGFRTVLAEKNPALRVTTV